MSTIPSIVHQSSINPKGSPSAPVWVIIEQPYEQDKDKGYCFSSSYGFIFHKMMLEAGLTDYYVCSRRPELTNRSTFAILENDLNYFKPPIIITLEEAGKHFCKELEKKVIKGAKTDEEHTSDIEKYAGSLLLSSKLNYPHYIIPSFSPHTIAKDWSQRDIVVSLDLGKAKSELDYFRRYGHLEPLPTRVLDIDFNDYDKLIVALERFKNASLLSNDIETVYPSKKSIYWPHPGEVVTVGLADSRSYGISFNLFRESKTETLDLWRRLDYLFTTIPQLGQNFFNFDVSRYEAYGFEIPLENVKDTLIRHHILWPELPHSLAFQTKQYTRQPYYKDDSTKWNGKNLKSLKLYNCLDVTVTMEVYDAQEKEFAERPHLK
jgi:hypothetical protein